MKFYQDSKSEIQSFLDKYFHQKNKEMEKDYLWGHDAITRLKEFVLPGKMLRGGLVILAASPRSDKDKNDAIMVGAALELLHSGILIHDDIMDQDRTRRGLPTIFAQYQTFAQKNNLVNYQRYGESMGACVGIISYFFAMEIISSISNKEVIPELSNVFGREMSALGLAQMMDVDGGYHRKDFTESDVSTLYEQKTSRYTFTLPLMVGNILSGKKQSQFDLYETLCKELGMIFQMQDDLFSLIGDPKETGKSIGSDIKEHKQTLIYLELLKKASEKEKQEIKKIYSTEDVTDIQVQQVINLMKKYDLFERSSELINNHYKKASNIIDQLGDDPFIKEQLKELLNFLIKRNK